jgi:hypothetical protein
MLSLTATAPELRSWAVAVAQLGGWLHDGMDYTDLNGTDGEVQVFTDYRRRVAAARAARRDILADPGGTLPPADRQPLIWQRGAAILARNQPAPPQ